MTKRSVYCLASSPSVAAEIVASLTQAGFSKGDICAAGSIVATLSDGEVSGIAGALVGLGIPKFDAKRYAEKIEAGDILISIRAQNSNEAQVAKGILELAEVEDISTAGEPAVGKPSEAIPLSPLND